MSWGDYNSHTQGSSSQQERILSPLWRLEAGNQGVRRAALLTEDPSCLPQPLGAQAAREPPPLRSRGPSRVCLISLVLMKTRLLDNSG